MSRNLRAAALVSAFRESLIRFSEANKALAEGRKIILGRRGRRRFRFQFECKMSGATAPHRVDFTLESGRVGLLRSMVLIGRNGTGKTEYLARLALAMSGMDQKGRFTPGRPPFGRVIAVSYSVFDVFERPTANSKRFSYRYCGLRRDAEEDDSPRERTASSAPLLTQRELLSRLRSSIELIEKGQRLGSWREMIRLLLPDDITGETDAAPLETLAFYEHLSSGQRVLVCILTEIITNVAEDTLILFDEPEMHLHPDLFSALIKVLRRVLQRFDAFAIIATHAPLLLQETPGRQVRVFRRIGNTPSVAPLQRESFGENLTTITHEVFEAMHSRDAVKDTLGALKRRIDSAAPRDVFPFPLPAQTAARVMALEKNKK